jgi:peptidoglycan hydrolase-like protein with peptidoglycan-binding domain
MRCDLEGLSHRPEWIVKGGIIMQKKRIVTAIILAASLGLGVQTVYAQYGSSEKSSGKSATKGQQSVASADEIMKAKDALRAKGLNPGPMDGTMDVKTQEALRQFQKSNNLPVTGMLDSQTAAKLGIRFGDAHDQDRPIDRDANPQGPEPNTGSRPNSVR